MRNKYPAAEAACMLADLWFRSSFFFYRRNLTAIVPSMRPGSGQLDATRNYTSATKITLSLRDDIGFDRYEKVLRGSNRLSATYCHSLLSV